METIDLQEGPQRLAGESEATVVFYGGTAGCGKSRWLVHEAAKYTDYPGYGFTLFRRTFPELRGIGSLWDETETLYPLLGATPVESRLEWDFPSGAQVRLAHLQLMKHAQGYQGKSLPGVGFDELTHFEEGQFWFIWSRLRGTSGAPKRCLATFNPDPDSWVKRMIEWYLGDDGYPISERSGVIRWFARVSGDLVWFDSREEALAALPAGVEPVSFTYISGKIWDNPALLSKDPGYLAVLQSLPPADQARFLGGNWNIRKAAGDFFAEDWFPIREAGQIANRLAGHPLDADIIQVIRCWDLAATPWRGDTVKPNPYARNEGEPPAWTRGLKVGRTRKGLYVVLDLVSCRDTPGAVEGLMIQTALADGPKVPVIVWQDPGQAAISQIETLTRNISREGKARLVPILARKDKEEYAGVPSRTAHRGRILVQRGPWNKAFFHELEGFPDGKYKDIVDALSLAFEHYLSEAPLEPPGDTSARTKEYAENDVRTTARFRSA